MPCIVSTRARGNHFLKARLLSISLGLVMLSGLAFGDSVTFAGSSGTNSASATFTVVGGNLQITLVNTGTKDATAISDALTAVFFDLTGASLTPVSVVAPAANTTGNGIAGVLIGYNGNGANGGSNGT